MTIIELEKEIEQYVKCTDQQSAEKHNQQNTVQINTVKPTKKYPVHKEQKDIREKTTEELKENWVNQKYNRKLHEYFTNKLLPENFNKCIKNLKKQIQENEFRKKYIGITVDGKWTTIVKAALLTQSNILQIFLSYKGFKEQKKVKQEAKKAKEKAKESKKTPDNSTGKVKGSNKTKPPSPRMGTVIKQKLSDWEQELIKAKDFKDPRIPKQFEYLKERLNQIENRYNYTASMTEEQLEDHLKEIETTIKVQVPRNTETKRETTYRYLKGLSDTNDLTIYKQRKRIKELEEEYEKDISPALTMTKEQFAKLTVWDQRNVLNELVQRAAHSKNEAIRQQNHNKHMELIREQAELMGEMITEQLETAKEQQIKKQISEQRSKLTKPEKLDLLEKMYRETYTTDHPFRDKDEKDDDKESVKSNETTDSQSPNWRNKLIKGLTSLINIAQDELEEILKSPPKTQLEPGQTLSIPPQRPKIQRKFLPQRSYSPLSNDLLRKRTYSPIPSEYEQKKFREHTPTPPPPEQGLSKVRKVPLSHDEITQQLESPEFWEDTKMPRYNPKVTTK
ncbi:14629_t:CDS:2, partial [Gigaspora rosea]